MIPYQSLKSRKNEAIPFLSWVTQEEMDKLKFVCFFPTFVQLVTTFFSLTKSYGINLEEETAEAFMDRCMELGNALSSPPKLYLKSSDNKHFLCFDWETWMKQADFII